MNKLPPRKRLMPIHRWAGVATQFERTEGGYLFRRHGWGPAVFVTSGERDALSAAGLRALLWHAAAFAMAAGVTWLLVGHLFATTSDALRAVIVGIAVSSIAIALYASQQWYADAPVRAVGHRPMVLPARDPDFRQRHPYGAIVATTLFLLFLAGIGTEQPPAFYIVFATCSVMLGLFLAWQRWRFDAALTPAQRRRAEVFDREEAARIVARSRNLAAQNPQSGWQVLLLLGFVVVQLLVLLGAVVAGVVTVAAVLGQSSDQLSFGPFMVGFIAGLVLGCALALPLDRLCKRWTGSSASDQFSWLPVDW